MPCVIDTNTALATSCQLCISLVENTHKVDRKIDIIPKNKGIFLSGTLLFLIPSPIKYKTGTRTSSSGLIKLITSSNNNHSLHSHCSVCGSLRVKNKDYSVFLGILCAYYTPYSAHCQEQMFRSWNILCIAQK